MQERVVAVKTSPISSSFIVPVPIALRESRELQERLDARPGISEIFPPRIASSPGEHAIWGLALAYGPLEIPSLSTLDKMAMAGLRGRAVSRVACATSGLGEL